MFAASSRRKVVVMTGGTGFLGSHFLFHLREREDLKVVPVVRASDAEKARARIDEAFAICAASYSVPTSQSGPSFSPIEGDIMAPFCGLSEEAIEAIRGGENGPIEVWHLAASLNFEERHRASIFAHNVTGTRNALDLARRLGATRFIYVSTAYTAGSVSGRVEEELHPRDTAFNNAYEESKCEAEHLVAEWAREHDVDWRILRPSIVVGPLETLKTGGTTTGFYGFMRELFRMRRVLGAVQRTLVVDGDSSMPVNLVPVDHVAGDMVHLLESDFPGGPIYHLTSRSAPRIDPMLAVFCRIAKLPRVRVAPRERDPIPIERLMDARMEFYGGYLRNGKEFARSLPARPAVNLDHVAGYISEFLRERTKTDRESIFEAGTTLGSDGTRMSTFRAGDESREPLILSNAYGMAADVWVPFVQQLEKKYRIITWETRALPNLSARFSPDTASIDDHARDLGLVMDAHGVSRAHVVGWCAGAQVALRFASKHPERVRGLVLLNGFFRLPEDVVPLTEFHRDLYSVIPACTRGVRQAQTWCDTIYGSRAAARDDEQRVNGILENVDPTLVHLTSAPFRSGEALYRFAHMLMNFREPAGDDWCRVLDIPSLVVTGTKDTIAHPAGSYEIASRIPGAELVVREAGDHFLLYHDAELPKLVDDFLQRAKSKVGRASWPAVEAACTGQ